MNTLSGDSNFTPIGFDQPFEDPIGLLNEWLKQAQSMDISEPYGFVLSTVSVEGKPSSRVVLLKECDAEGIVFASSEQSTKGQQIAVNPQVAGNLWWRETLQQMNFQGRVKPLSAVDSDKIFAGRTREAQAAAIVSQQSQTLHNLEAFEKQVKALVVSNETLTRPRDWHGYHIKITQIEFWHGNPNRMHKRLEYRLNGNGWAWNWLQP